MMTCLLFCLRRESVSAPGMRFSSMECILMFEIERNETSHAEKNAEMARSTRSAQARIMFSTHPIRACRIKTYSSRGS
jgi:hypothetical protein